MEATGPLQQKMQKNLRGVVDTMESNSVKKIPVNIQNKYLDTVPLSWDGKLYYYYRLFTATSILLPGNYNFFPASYLDGLYVHGGNDSGLIQKND